MDLMSQDQEQDVRRNSSETDILLATSTVYEDLDFDNQPRHNMARIRIARDQGRRSNILERRTLSTAQGDGLKLTDRVAVPFIGGMGVLGTNMRTRGTLRVVLKGGDQGNKALATRRMISSNHIKRRDIRGLANNSRSNEAHALLVISGIKPYARVLSQVADLIPDLHDYREDK